MLREGLVRDASNGGQATLPSDDPDPRLLQTAFLVLFLLAAALTLAGGTRPQEATGPIVGSALVTIACVMAVLLPWERVPRVFLGLVPVVDSRPWARPG